jgi:hypothetical protein
MRRPFLNEIPLSGARSGGLSILIGPEEWDEDIQAAYDAGHTLIEFGSTELAVRAFRKLAIDSQPDLFMKGRSL